MRRLHISRFVAHVAISNLQFQRSPSGAAEQPRLKIMRRASLFTTLIGTFFLAMAFAAPTILRWQTEYTLGQMGASKYVDVAVSADLDRLAFDLLLTKVLSVAILVSGVLMLRRIKQGLFLGLSAYAACVCVALYSFIVLGWAFVPLFEAAAWAYAFHYVLSAHRQSGSNWWRQSN